MLYNLSYIYTNILFIELLCNLGVFVLKSLNNNLYILEFIDLFDSEYYNSSMSEFK